MKRKKRKKIIDIFKNIMVRRRTTDPDNEDWRLELNEMVIGKDRLDSCAHCGIIFEKQGDICPNCRRPLNHDIFR